MSKPEVNEPVDQLLVLKLNGIDLFVSQDEVGFYDERQQLNYSDNRPDAVGVLKNNGQDILCFYLDDELEVKNRVPDEFETTVVLEKDNYRIALMCREVTQLEYSEFTFQAVPDCMSVKRSPLTGFCVYMKDDDLHLGMMTDTASLVNYVGI